MEVQKKEKLMEGFQECHLQNFKWFKVNGLESKTLANTFGKLVEEGNCFVSCIRCSSRDKLRLSNCWQKCWIYLLLEFLRPRVWCSSVIQIASETSNHSHFYSQRERGIPVLWISDLLCRVSSNITSYSIIVFCYHRLLVKPVCCTSRNRFSSNPARQLARHKSTGSLQVGRQSFNSRIAYLENILQVEPLPFGV